jgi:uncharacterized protein
MRITIRVRPGSARPGVGGEQAGALVVRVSAPAVDGRATEAALAAVAAAFGVRREAVTLVTGKTSRTKVVEVADGDPRILAGLLGGPLQAQPVRRPRYVAGSAAARLRYNRTATCMAARASAWRSSAASRRDWWSSASARSGPYLPGRSAARS